MSKKTISISKTVTEAVSVDVVFPFYRRYLSDYNDGSVYCVHEDLTYELHLIDRNNRGEREWQFTIHETEALLTESFVLCKGTFRNYIVVHAEQWLRIKAEFLSDVEKLKDVQ